MDPIFSVLNHDRDNAKPIGDVDLVSILGKNPEALLNRSAMLELEGERAVLEWCAEAGLLPNSFRNFSNRMNMQHKNASTNAKLKMMVKKLKLKIVELESQLATNESKLAEELKALNATEKELKIVKETLQANETEISRLNTLTGQLQGLVYQYKHMTLQNQEAWKNYSALEDKMKTAQNTIKRYNRKLAQYRREKSDKNESFKLKDHIRRLWKLIRLGSAETGLTIKEKKKLTEEYKEWFPSENIFLQFKGKKNDATNILHDMPTNLLEILTTENFIEMPNSVGNQAANEETSSSYSKPALLSSDYKVSSSDDSPNNTVQPVQCVPDTKSETTCNKKVLKALNVPSYPCSPDSLSHQDDANTHSTEVPAISLEQLKSPVDSALNVESSLTQQLTDTSNLNCFSTLFRPKEVPSTSDNLQESLEQSSCTVINNEPPKDIQNNNDIMEQSCAPVESIQPSNPEKQKTVLRAEISNSVPVRVKGRILLDRGVLKKRKMETVSNDEVKQQAELKRDQALTSNSTNLEESFAQSDYAVVCKPKKIRLEHKKIVCLSTSNPDNVLVNTDETVLITSDVSSDNDNNKQNKGKKQASSEIEAFKEAVSRIKNKANKVIALLNLFPSKSKEIVHTNPSFIATEESASFNLVPPTCIEDLIFSSLSKEQPKYDAISYPNSGNSLGTTKNFGEKEECLVSTSKTKDESIEEKNRNIFIENDLNVHAQISNYVSNPGKSKINKKAENMAKISDECGTSEQPSLILSDTKYDKNKILSESVIKHNSILNREHSGLGTHSCTKKNQQYFSKNVMREVEKKELRKVQCKTPENPLEKFFQDFHDIQSNDKFNAYLQSLVDVLSNQDNIPNSSILLFHILNYLQNSRKNPLHTFSLNEDWSVLLPSDENCIVTALYAIEFKKEPHLHGLLQTAITMINHIILAKQFTASGLASLCRMFTEICKREKDSIKPIILCGDLLKIKHPSAPFLIACMASIWKELFQVGESLPVEEKLFHSSILYGATNNTKKLEEFLKKPSISIISKYFTAPPVNDARSAMQILKNFIETKCQNDSWSHQYMTSALIILAGYEDWDWIQINLLDNYIVPNLIKFGRRTLSRVAFDLYCNLYVDIWFLKSGPFSCKNYLSVIFNDPEMWQGATFVSECVALALIRLIYMKDQLLPPSLASWFESNHHRPIVQKIADVVIRKLMRESKSELLLQDVQRNTYNCITVNIV